MSPNQREREYQRRRYEEWQKRLEEKKAARAQRNRTIAAVVSAVAVVGVALGVLWLTSGDDNPVTPAAEPTPSAAASPSDEASPSPSSSASGAKNPCPPTTAKPADENMGSWETPPPVGDTGSHTYTLTLATSCGDIKATLDGTKAPKAVASTVFLVENDFYNDTPCHRLTTEGIFVLQCGDPTGTGSGGPGYTYGPVENAPKDQLYPAGTIAMARATEETSQGSQFFIVYKDSQIPGNYTVLGRLTDGLEIVQKVAKGGVAEGGPGGTADGQPMWPISIKSASVKQN